MPDKSDSDRINKGFADFCKCDDESMQNEKSIWQLQEIVQYPAVFYKIDAEKTLWMYWMAFYVPYSTEIWNGCHFVLFFFVTVDKDERTNSSVSNPMSTWFTQQGCPASGLWLK